VKYYFLFFLFLLFLFLDFAPVFLGELALDGCNSGSGEVPEGPAFDWLPERPASDELPDGLWYDPDDPTADAILSNTFAAS
jgi:hypothetical protein